jgi:hypothetical protein
MREKVENDRRVYLNATAQVQQGDDSGRERLCRADDLDRRMGSASR